MYTLKIIEHKNISNKDLEKVCEIKSIFGNYSLKSQMNWIEKNLTEDDKHFLLYEGSTFVGYINLITTQVYINDKSVDVVGIGNVCVKMKGIGLGSILMKKLNKYLKEENKIGILFCKPKLVNFYSKFNWKNVCFDSTKNVHTMIYNVVDTKLVDIKYDGDLF